VIGERRSSSASSSRHQRRDPGPVLSRLWLPSASLAIAFTPGFYAVLRLATVHDWVDPRTQVIPAPPTFFARCGMALLLATMAALALRPLENSWPIALAASLALLCVQTACWP
jgi:DMSO/TMAO reductase YedYZ heme-binding membrane subunit